MFSKSSNVTPSVLFPVTVYDTETLVAKPTEYCMSQLCSEENEARIDIETMTDLPLRRLGYLGPRLRPRI